jgi:hypothetical protein
MQCPLQPVCGIVLQPSTSHLFPFFLLSSFFCVQLLLFRMGRTISIATRLWKFVAALNSTPLFCIYSAFAARNFAQDHPLLRRSQQMPSNPEVDTTPLVAHCAGPIF